MRTLNFRAAKYIIMLYLLEPPCKQELEKYSAEKPMLGKYEPTCDEDGYYKPRQCHENYCWCVDRYNQMIEGSKKESWLVSCGKCTLHTHSLYTKTRHPKFKSYKNVPDQHNKFLGLLHRSQAAESDVYSLPFTYGSIAIYASRG